jgi:hypothetical protein
MSRTPWRKAFEKRLDDPEVEARIQGGARAMLDAAVLARLRESRGITQKKMASDLCLSQVRISRIEHQKDIYLSHLSEYVEALGGRLHVTAEFPDETVELVTKIRD